MAIMIVREVSDAGERMFELNREHLERIRTLTGMDETSIYTKLNSGQPLENDNYHWRMVKQ